MDPQEARLFRLALVIVTVFGTALYLFVVSLRRQHRRVLELKLRNMRAELESIERERARIAADLHDELAPVLSAIKFKISSFELADDEDRLQQQKTDEHLGDVLQRIRTISYNLMPATLKRKGLPAAIREFASYVSHRERLQIEATVENVSLGEVQCIHLYRVVQEIVQNAVKHAGATLLQMDLRERDAKVVLSTRDDGRGFNPDDSLAGEGGFGLRNLYSRTDVLGGVLTIESRKGKGTVHIIEIPVN